MTTARTAEITRRDCAFGEQSLFRSLRIQLPQAYETALDWSVVALKFKTDEELRKERNIYYLAKKYEQKYGQTGQANCVAKWDDLKDNL